MPLTGKQKRHLRALGHHLSAVVQVGSSGVTEGVIAAAAQALADHELIKVKIAAERDEREAAVGALVEGTGAELAQMLGKTALLFKKRTKKSKFDAVVPPAGRDAGRAEADDEPQSADGPKAPSRALKRSPVKRTRP